MIWVIGVGEGIIKLENTLKRFDILLLKIFSNKMCAENLPNILLLKLFSNKTRGTNSPRYTLSKIVNNKLVVQMYHTI